MYKQSTQQHTYIYTGTHAHAQAYTHKYTHASANTRAHTHTPSTKTQHTIHAHDTPLFIITHLLILVQDEAEEHLRQVQPREANVVDALHAQNAAAAVVNLEHLGLDRVADTVPAPLLSKEAKGARPYVNGGGTGGGGDGQQ